MARKDEDAAVAAAAAMFADEDETEDTVAQQGAEDEAAAQGTEDTGAVEAEEEILFPAWEVELPEGLQEELEAPSLEDEQLQEEPEEGEEYLDDQSRQLLARARAAEKKAEYYEKLRIQEARKNWQEEARKFFPLSAHVLDTIDADSRKGYLRQAKAAHEAVIPYVKEVTDKARETIEAERTKAVEQARQEAETAWGKVPAKAEPPAQATITQERLARNRSKGDLSSTIKAMIFPSKEE